MIRPRSSPAPADLVRRCGATLVTALVLGSCSVPEEGRLVEHTALGDLIASERSDGREAPEGDLFLAAGTTATVAVLSPVAAELRVAGIESRGGAELTIEVETDGGPSDSWTLGAAREAQHLDLPADQPIRLSLTAEGAAEGGVLLREPTIWGRSGALIGPVTRSTRDAAGGSAPAPPVVLYLIDTLRRDRLGCYGYQKPITPEIDAFAARATLFEDATGQSSWTKASVASAFTGVWPPAHGAISWRDRLSESFETLAESLENGGYRTAAFSTNPHITAPMGFDQGFQDFLYGGGHTSASLNELLFEWLDGVRDEPFFLYAQPMDPHAAYNPPQEFLERHAPGIDPLGWRHPRWKFNWPVKALPTLEALYDAEIAANDASFGALLDELERLGFYDDALIVLTSDHGEEFQERGGWRHGNHLYAETQDVPLIVKFPGQSEGRRVRGPAQHIDILPTVLEAAGLPVPAGVEGVGLSRGGVERPVYAHLRLGGKPAHLTVTDGRWKLMQRRRPDGIDTFLYDLDEDPGESLDLSGRFPVRTAAMTSLLDAHLAATGEVTAETVEIDAETERTLRSLGYLQ